MASYAKLIENFDLLKKASNATCVCRIDEKGNASLFFRGVKIAHKTKEGRLFLTTANLTNYKGMFTAITTLREKYASMPDPWDTAIWNGKWIEVIPTRDRTVGIWSYVD